MARIYEVVSFGPISLRGVRCEMPDPLGPKFAHEELGELIAKRQVAVTFGVVTPEEYFAGVESDSLPPSPEVEELEVPEGLYAKQKLNRWIRRTHRIGPALETLGYNALHMKLGNDFSRPEVEIYHHQIDPNDPDHLDLLFPVRRRRAPGFQL